LSVPGASYEGDLGLTGARTPGGYALRCGHGTVAYLLEGADYPGQAEWRLPGFRADDLDAVVSDLIARGVQPELIADGWNRTDDRGIAELDGMRIAWLRDPDGQVIAIFQLTRDADHGA
jgi:hypothetical protein